jgi:hypothetical protein
VTASAPSPGTTDGTAAAVASPTTAAFARAAFLHHLPVVLELLSRVSRAAFAFSRVSLAALLLVGTLEVRDLLLGERPVELLVELG